MCGCRVWHPFPLCFPAALCLVFLQRCAVLGGGVRMLLGVLLLLKFLLAHTVRCAAPAQLRMQLCQQHAWGWVAGRQPFAHSADACVADAQLVFQMLGSVSCLPF